MMKDFRDWLPWSSRSVAATLGAVVLLAASAATRDFAPAAFVHRAISEAVDHTLVADMDGDGRNDVALQIHRDDHHLGKLTGRKTPPGSEPPENPVSYQSIAPRSYTIIHELPQQCFRPDDEANPSMSGTKSTYVCILHGKRPLYATIGFIVHYSWKTMIDATCSVNDFTVPLNKLQIETESLAIAIPF